MDSTLKYLKDIFLHKSLQSFISYIIYYIKDFLEKLKIPYTYKLTTTYHLLTFSKTPYSIRSHNKTILWYSDFGKELPELERQQNFRYSLKNNGQIALLGQLDI